MSDNRDGVPSRSDRDASLQLTEPVSPPRDSEGLLRTERRDPALARATDSFSFSAARLWIA